VGRGFEEREWMAKIERKSWREEWRFWSYEQVRRESGSE
jgi:hypothetical protein